MISYAVGMDISANQLADGMDISADHLSRWGGHFSDFEAIFDSGFF